MNAAVVREKKDDDKGLFSSASQLHRGEEDARSDCATYGSNSPSRARLAEAMNAALEVSLRDAQEDDSATLRAIELAMAESLQHDDAGVPQHPDVPEKKAITLGCKDEATDAACSQLGTLKSGVLVRARKALVAAQTSHRLTAPAPVLDAILPLLRALGAVAEDGDKTGSATETVALTGSLDQALAYLDEAREARVAAFNEELKADLKAQGLPELTQSLLSISPAGKEDDDKCAFFSASQLYRTGTARSDCASHGSNSPQMKRGRTSA